jgi:hypothetical protein
VAAVATLRELSGPDVLHSESIIVFPLLFSRRAQSALTVACQRSGNPEKASMIFIRTICAI